MSNQNSASVYIRVWNPSHYIGLTQKSPRTWQWAPKIESRAVTNLHLLI